MAFVVYGSSNGTPNSYVDIATADQYFLDREETQWANLSIAEKQVALIRGTDYLDRHFRFKSQKQDASQNLMFPRVQFGTDTIPVEIKKAAMEYALFYVKGTLYDVEKIQITGQIKKTRTKEKVGSLETETENEFVGAGEIREVHESRFDAISYLVADYIIDEHGISTLKPSESSTDQISGVKLTETNLKRNI